MDMVDVYKDDFVLISRRETKDGIFALYKFNSGKKTKGFFVRKDGDEDTLYHIGKCKILVNCKNKRMVQRFEKFYQGLIDYHEDKILRIEEDFWIWLDLFLQRRDSEEVTIRSKFYEAIDTM